jgi:hypothetical protein
MQAKTIIGLIKHYLLSRLDEINKAIIISNSINADSYSEIGQAKEVQRIITLITKLEVLL